MKSFTVLSSSLLLAMALSASVAAQPARQGGGARQAPPPPPAPPAPMHVEHHTTTDGARVVASRVIIRTNKGEFEISREGDKVDVRPKGNVGAVNIEQTDRAVIISDESGVLAEVQIAPGGGLHMTSSRNAGAMARELAFARAMERGFGGASPRARLGIVLGQVDGALAAQLGVDPSEVILISSVSEGEAAEKAGLKRHDIIVKVDGESPVVQARLREIMQSKEPGDTLAIEVLREGQPVRVEVKLEPFSEQLALERIYEMGNRFVAPEVMEELRAMRVAPEQFQFDALRRDFMQQRPRLRATVEQLRHEAQVLREELEREIMKWRETAMDEELRAKLRESLGRAAEQAAQALERIAEEMSESEARAPHIEFLREGAAGGRGMVVHPPAPPSPRVAPGGLGGAGGAGGAAGGGVGGRAGQDSERMDQRFSRMEQRLERLERMLERLLEREQN